MATIETCVLQLNEVVSDAHISYKLWECSECTKTHVTLKNDSIFCPNCGRKVVMCLTGSYEKIDANSQSIESVRDSQNDSSDF